MTVDRCKDRALENVWNDWYETRYLPAAMNSSFESFTRFRAASVATSEPGDYITLCENCHDELVDVPVNGLDIASRAEHSAAALNVRVFGGLYHQIAEIGGHNLDLATGLLVALVNCREGHSEAELNEWYDEHHLPDVLRSSTFYGARRYRSARPDSPRFFVMYETDMRDPDTALGLLRAYREHSPMPMPPVVDVVYWKMYHRRPQRATDLSSRWQRHSIRNHQ